MRSRSKSLKSGVAIGLAVAGATTECGWCLDRVVTVWVTSLSGLNSEFEWYSVVVVVESCVCPGGAESLLAHCMLVAGPEGFDPSNSVVTTDIDSEFEVSDVRSYVSEDCYGCCCDALCPLSWMSDADSASYDDCASCGLGNSESLCGESVKYVPASKFRVDSVLERSYFMSGCMSVESRVVPLEVKKVGTEVAVSDSQCGVDGGRLCWPWCGVLDGCDSGVACRSSRLL